jgi:hypothetical protein
MVPLAILLSGTSWFGRTKSMAGNLIASCVPTGPLTLPLQRMILARRKGGVRNMWLSCLDMKVQSTLIVIVRKIQGIMEQTSLQITCSGLCSNMLHYCFVENHTCLLLHETSARPKRGGQMLHMRSMAPMNPENWWELVMFDHRAFGAKIILTLNPKRHFSNLGLDKHLLKWSCSRSF